MYVNLDELSKRLYGLIPKHLEMSKYAIPKNMQKRLSWFRDGWRDLRLD